MIKNIRTKFTSILIVGIIISPASCVDGTGDGDDGLLPDGGSADAGEETDDESNYTAEGQAGCIEHTLSLNKQALVSSGFLDFSWFFKNICNNSIIVGGKIYIELQNERSDKITLPETIRYSASKQIPSGDVLNAADFGASLFLSTADEKYVTFFTSSSVAAVGKFEGTITGDAGATSFFTSAIVIDMSLANSENENGGTNE